MCLDEITWISFDLIEHITTLLFIEKFATNLDITRFSKD
jgi:hypothetical protein